MERVQRYRNVPASNAQTQHWRELQVVIGLRDVQGRDGTGVCVGGGVEGLAGCARRGWTGGDHTAKCVMPRLPTCEHARPMVGGVEMGTAVVWARTTYASFCWKLYFGAGTWQKSTCAMMSRASSTLLLRRFSEYALGLALICEPVRALRDAEQGLHDN
eukprot:146817-Chlamydomonas_euryale.AAC.2